MVTQNLIPKKDLSLLCWQCGETFTADPKRIEKLEEIERPVGDKMVPGYKISTHCQNKECTVLNTAEVPRAYFKE